MKWTVVGLGNPGDEYEYTRHNAGRMAVALFDRAHEFGGFVADSKSKSLISKGDVGTHTATLVLPETFMNTSGSAVARFVKSKKAAERLVVVHDDIDVPFGRIKISFGRGSGGHKGVESIIKTLQTKDFVRVRIGVAPTTPKGTIKKPRGEKHVHDFLLGAFTKKEERELSEVLNTASAAVESIVLHGQITAMNRFN